MRWADLRSRGDAPWRARQESNLRLSAAAADMLDALPRCRDLVFTGADGQAVSNMQRRWIAIRNAANLHDLRIHDIRHAWASNAAMHGVPLAMIGRQLGHAKPATTQRYAHLADDVVAQAVDRVGEIIAANTARGDASPKVVALPKAGV